MRGACGTADEVARALVAAQVAPDAAVAWAARRGAGWEVSGGRAGSPEAEEPIFDLASLTKPMLAVALARSELGRERAIGDLLEEAAETPSAPMPLELLVAHRAGLEAHVSLYAPLLEGAPFDRSAALRTAALSRRGDAIGPAPPGGFAPLYSDLGYILAGEALARSAGARDAGEIIERLVALPLGLTAELGTARALRRAGVSFDRRVRPTEIAPWRGGEIRGAVHDENAWALTGDGGSGHAGMFGTAAAVLGFGCAVLDALAGRAGALEGADLAWLVEERPGGTLRAGFDGKSAEASSAGELAGPRAFGHLGFTGTSIWIDPDADAVVVVLTNRVHPTRENVRIRAARPLAHDALFELARQQLRRPG